MLLGDIVDKLLDEYGLAHSSASEKADFSSFEVRFQQVYDLDAGKEHLLRGLEILELGRFPVDGEFPFARKRSQAVDCIARNIHHSAPYLGT